jgi:8-oxo-dGTP diphosphatase
MAREYPAHPVVGVGAVVVRDGRALLVRRGHEPRKGEWSLPGGLLDLGDD